MSVRAALDPSINYSLRERANRVSEALLISLAHRLPYRLRYRVYIDFACQHLLNDDVVPEVRMMDILERAQHG